MNTAENLSIRMKNKLKKTTPRKSCIFMKVQKIRTIESIRGKCWLQTYEFNSKIRYLEFSNNALEVTTQKVWKVMLEMYYKLSALTEIRSYYRFTKIRQQKVLTSITPMLLSSISSWFTLLIFVCKRLDINLITFKRVFPTGGSNTPQVVFMTLF